MDELKYIENNDNFYIILNYFIKKYLIYYYFLFFKILHNTYTIY